MSDPIGIYIWGSVLNLMFSGPALAQAFGYTTYSTGARFWIGVAAFWILGALMWPVLLPLIMWHLETRGR